MHDINFDECDDWAVGEDFSFKGRHGEEGKGPEGVLPEGTQLCIPILEHANILRYLES